MPATLAAGRETDPATLTGRFRQVHPILYGVSAAFAAYFLWGGG